MKVKVNLEYIWIGGNGEFRSKNKIHMLDKPSTSIAMEDIPEWNYDGSSTQQAQGIDTEVILKPVKYVVSPFPLKHCDSYLVLCETTHSDRNIANRIFDLKLESKPWFGLEQEYFMIGDSISNDTEHQGPYYCGVGKGKHALERQVALEHLDACLYAGLEISGINAEVAHCQWEYQIGPCIGIDAGDQLLLSRYILERIAEKHGITIVYDPKPFPHINGSGCHVNFSTEEMRQDMGIKVIQDAIQSLSGHHDDLIFISGQDNYKRLTGIHETSSMDRFTYGIGTRHTSVRIPNGVSKEGKGYFEDRRCAANMNPYVVTSTIFKLCCLNEG